MIMPSNRVELWLCQACGEPHMVPGRKVGNIGACRRCHISDVIANHTDDLTAQANARKLRMARKAGPKQTHGK